MTDRAPHGTADITGDAVSQGRAPKPTRFLLDKVLPKPGTDPIVTGNIKREYVDATADDDLAGVQ